MSAHAKRFAVGGAVAALLIAASWLAGGVLGETRDCWGCRVPLGFLLLLMMFLGAGLVYGIGNAVIAFFTDGDA